jgi:hypothetical protein
VKPEFRNPHSSAAAAGDKSPHKEDEHCTNDATDKTSTLTSLIPPESLSEVGRDQGTYNAHGCSENEALGLAREGSSLDPASVR